MRIRSKIFLWLLLAIIVPLTVLALATTYYVEYEYQRSVREDITASLNSLGSELERRMQAHRDLALGLARANAIQEFLPHIKEFENGEHVQLLDNYRSRISHYFEGFQTIVQGQYIMRVMDRFGNSLVKVSHNKRSEALYESLSGVFYVEQELTDSKFRERLENLPAGEVSNIELPHYREHAEEWNIRTLPDYIVPLYYQDELTGALSLTLYGENIDRIIRHAPRLYKSELFMIENNPDDKRRHGLLLYDDRHQINLSNTRNETITLGQYYGEALLPQIVDQVFGQVTDQQTGEQIYYVEMFPNPGRLVSWVIATRVQTAVITEPFQQIRWIIWLVALLSFVTSLVLANIGVHIIARPIQQLAQNLLSYAKGEHDQRAKTDASIDEIRDLELAFNTLADSLDKTSSERDNAQRMMLQSAKLASIGEMAAGIGHEINNPLNNILSYAKLIARSAAMQDDALQKDLASLKEEAIRASDIVKGILNFARQVPPHYAPFEVRQWLQDTLNLVKQTAIDAGITLAYECEENGLIEGDRAQLQQALINLLINAIQASREYGQVLVKVHFSGQQLILSVIDQGAGIDEKVIDKVFDPFFTTKQEGEGSGLGMSISHGIIERHGGRLSINNNQDMGVTVTMNIPVSKVTT